MIVLDQQNIVTILSAAGLMVSFGGLMLAMQRSLRQDIMANRSDLKGDIAGLRTELADTRAELKQEIADTRTELKGDIGKLGDRMTMIEQRTYDLRGLRSPVPHTGT